MHLSSELFNRTKSILKHPREIVLALALGFTVSCTSLDTNLREYPFAQRQEILTDAQQQLMHERFEPLSGSSLPKYHTTAHVFLDMEKDFGASVRDYISLDALLDNAHQRVVIKKKYDLTDTITNLKVLDTLIAPYKEEPKKARSSLLSRCLEDGLLDCDSLSFILLSCAETIHMPLALGYIPHHIFIKIPTQEGYCNWDGIQIPSNQMLSDSEYKKEWLVEPTEKWPKTLDKKGVIALEYSNRGTTSLELYYYLKWQENKGEQVNQDKKIFYLENALDDLNKSLTLYPELYDSLLNEAKIYYELQMPDVSLRILKKAELLWQKDDMRLAFEGKIFYEKGDYVSALAYLNEAIEINPSCREAYETRSDLWSHKGKKKKANDDIGRALDLYFQEKF